MGTAAHQTPRREALGDAAQDATVPGDPGEGTFRLLVSSNAAEMIDAV
jgi:hypothetical protein